MNRAIKRGIVVSLLLALALTNASCSFVNKFVIVNVSRAALQVQYHVKNPTDPRAPARLSGRVPQTKPRGQVDEQVTWQPLPSWRYRIDADNRTVVLTLEPNEALLLTQCRPANGASSGDCQAEDFDIDEIGLAGINGEATLKGETAHKMFVRSRNTYTLTYY